MLTRIFMPKLGMTMEEGTIIRWLKKVGDPVKKGEPLLEVETDKIAMEVEAEGSGYLLEIVHPDGDMVPVIETIGYIGEQGERPPEDAGTPVKAAAVQETAARPSAKQDCDYDVIVVGAGPAGYFAAIRAAQRGGHVLIIEQEAVGGTCLNHGCIPTKTFLHSAALLSEIQHRAAECGVVVGAGVHLDMRQLQKRKKRVVRKLTSGVGALLRSNQITVEQGTAEVHGDKTVAINGKTWSAKSVIFAGGAVPVRPNLPGVNLEGVLDSRALLELETLPRSLVILGGDVIGAEFASAFQAFGTQVTLVEAGAQLLPGADAELAEALRKSLHTAGVTVLLNANAEAVEATAGELCVKVNGQRLPAEKVLLSYGRKANCTGITGAGVQMQNDFIAVNEKMETSVPQIYAIGDANGICLTAHAAFAMAEVAAENALGGDSRYCPAAVPTCIFTNPEIAWVGLSPDATGQKTKTGTFAFTANGRALSLKSSEGYVKVVTDAATDELLGVQIVGGGATELIATAAALIGMEMTADEVAKLVFAHPTCSEALKEACEDSLNRSVHSLPK